LSRFFHVLHNGLCHSRSTLFLDHALDTSKQFLRSTLELSFENTHIRSSGGRRLIGVNLCSRSSDGDMVMSRRDETPMEDCESFLCAVKKSVSS